MTKLHQQLLRALIAAQVATIEDADEDVGGPDTALDALDTALKEATRVAKLMRKERRR